MENSMHSAHRAPIPEDEPLPGEQTPPEEDPVPHPDPEIREPADTPPPMQAGYEASVV
jgi:hypothetical protein